VFLDIETNWIGLDRMWHFLFVRFVGRRHGDDASSERARERERKEKARAFFLSTSLLLVFEKERERERK